VRLFRHAQFYRPARAGPGGIPVLRAFDMGRRLLSWKTSWLSMARAADRRGSSDRDPRSRSADRRTPSRCGCSRSRSAPRLADVLSRIGVVQELR